MTIETAAELSSVHEVTLRGTAGLDYWTRRLQAEELVPRPVNGRAELLVISARARYKGIPFREISFTVAVEPVSGGPPGDAVFLVEAFNSVRAFAFVERLIFKTPYRHGRFTSPPADRTSVHLEWGNAFYRMMRGEDGPGLYRYPPGSPETRWSGTVFLPTPPGASLRRVFFAAIQGPTGIAPVDPSRDAVMISPGSSPGVLTELRESGFSGSEWIVREEAMHSRSKSYERQVGLARWQTGDGILSA